MPLNSRQVMKYNLNSDHNLGLIKNGKKFKETIPTKIAKIVMPPRAFKIDKRNFFIIWIYFFKSLT